MKISGRYICRDLQINRTAETLEQLFANLQEDLDIFNKLTGNKYPKTFRKSSIRIRIIE